MVSFLFTFLTLGLFSGFCSAPQGTYSVPATPERGTEQSRLQRGSQSAPVGTSRLRLNLSRQLLFLLAGKGVSSDSPNISLRCLLNEYSDRDYEGDKSGSSSAFASPASSKGKGRMEDEEDEGGEAGACAAPSTPRDQGVLQEFWTPENQKTPTYEQIFQQQAQQHHYSPASDGYTSCISEQGLSSGDSEADA